MLTNRVRSSEVNLAGPARRECEADHNQEFSFIAATRLTVSDAAPIGGAISAISVGDFGDGSFGDSAQNTFWPPGPRASHG
jgi:hypothetical protein